MPSETRRLVLGDPNWTRSADDFGRASGGPHFTDEPGASGHRRRLDNVGGRRCGASSVAKSPNGPYPALYSHNRDTDAECIARHNGGAISSCEGSTEWGGGAPCGRCPSINRPASRPCPRRTALRSVEAAG